MLISKAIYSKREDCVDDYTYAWEFLEVNLFPLFECIYCTFYQMKLNYTTKDIFLNRLIKRIEIFMLDKETDILSEMDQDYMQDFADRIRETVSGDIEKIEYSVELEYSKNKLPYYKQKAWVTTLDIMVEYFQKVMEKCQETILENRKSTVSLDPLWNKFDLKNIRSLTFDLKNRICKEKVNLNIENVNNGIKALDNKLASLDTVKNALEKVS